MDLATYVIEHAVRGACVCGSCIDAPPDPEKCQPDGHTADVMFFKVAMKDKPDPKTFRAFVEEEYPNWLDGEEHSYLEIGADLGGQGIALMAMGLGSLLEIWQLLTPKSIASFLPDALQMEMAGQGMVTIKALTG